MIFRSLVSITLLLFSDALLASQPLPATVHNDVLCSESNFSLAAIQQRQQDANYNSESYTQWFSPNKESKPKSIALVVHGIAMPAQDMKHIVKALISQRHEVLRVTLHGHGGNKSEYKTATRATWLDNLLESYCLARERADQLQVPLNFVGYSLGALVNMDLMNGGFRQDIQYSKMVLFAPAIALRTRIHILRTLVSTATAFIPKLAPLFGAFFDTYEHLIYEDLSPSNIPTTVFLDPKDELVSQKKLSKVLARNNLTRWNHIAISNKHHETRKAHHYVIFPPALGADQWNSMTNEMLKSFD